MFIDIPTTLIPSIRAAHGGEPAIADIVFTLPPELQTLYILAATVTIILILLLIARCTVTDSQRRRFTQEKEPEASQKKPSLRCPMCGWLHAEEQKVCRNPRCNIRF